jgi:TonB-dependent starch-binding outer membrane protein SusC
LFALLLVLGLLSAKPASADGENAPNVKLTRVTLSVTKAPLTSFIRKVEAQTPFRFTFDEQPALTKTSISITARDESLENVLARVAATTHLEFKQVNNNIHVRLRRPAGPEANLFASNTPVAVLMVTGKVSDEKGEGLPGVTVLEKGTTNGTITDVNGRFSLSTPGSNVTLIVSYVGFLTQEVDVKNQTALSITLKADAKNLEEVVVIGYGSVQRKDLTGSIASVSNEAIKDLAVTRVDQALLGKVSGVQVKPSSGEPGAAPQIRIRGVGSISAGAGPLYVVDGFPVASIQMLKNVESQRYRKHGCVERRFRHRYLWLAWIEWGHHYQYQKGKDRQACHFL